MSLLIDSWRNFAATLWQKEAVAKLHAHQLDSAWSGLHIETSKVVNPGEVVAPYDTNEPADYRIVSDLAAGTITIDPVEAGFYQVNYYFNFDAGSNGGTYIFEFYIDGVSTGNGVVVSLSNQSSVGNAAMCGFNSIQSGVLDLRLDGSSTRAITMAKTSWSVVRLYPLL